jgi:hypothetical protein
MLNKITLKKFKKSPVPGAGWLEKTAEDRLLPKSVKFADGKTCFRREPGRFENQGHPVGTTKPIGDGMTIEGAGYLPS